jgi:hypothetical protein
MLATFVTRRGVHSVWNKNSLRWKNKASRCLWPRDRTPWSFANATVVDWRRRIINKRKVPRQRMLLYLTDGVGSSTKDKCHDKEYPWIVSSYICSFPSIGWRSHALLWVLQNGQMSPNCQICVEWMNESKAAFIFCSPIFATNAVTRVVAFSPYLLWYSPSLGTKQL